MDELADIPVTYIHLIVDWMNREHVNNTEDLKGIYVRKSLQYIYPLFVFLYIVVALVGIAGNIAMVVVIFRRRLYQNPMFAYFLNLGLSDLIKCLLVLPPTLPILFIENWVFGSFLCYFFPMLQYFPIHASMLTMLVISIDRFRHIVYPMKSRIPAGLCIIASWVISVCVVLPYAIYIKFIDLGQYVVEDLRGVGLCVVASGKDLMIEEYIRAAFVVMYALPLAIIAFLCVRISAEFKSRENESWAPNPAPAQSFEGSLSAHSIEPECASGSSTQPLKEEVSDGSEEEEMDLYHEKRTQKYIISMVIVFGICWCPLHVLSLITPVTSETVHNKAYFDITYNTFVWFGFLSTCSNPIMFASLCMTDSAKDRLRDYFKLMSRNRRSSQQIQI